MRCWLRAMLLAAFAARGAQAMPGQAPTTDTQSKWAVAITLPAEDDRLLCSGAIITTEHIITAASCFFEGRDGFSKVTHPAARCPVECVLRGDLMF
jgi:hypothetical protein